MSLSLSSCNRSSKSLTIFTALHIALHWTHSTVSISLSHWGHRPGHSTPEVASPVLRGRDYILWLASYVLANTAQVAVGHLCCKCVLLTHGQLCVCLQVLFCQATFQPAVSRYITLYGIIPSWDSCWTSSFTCTGSPASSPVHMVY